MRRVVELGWTFGAPNEKMPLVMRLAGVRSLGRLIARIPVNEWATRSLLARVGLRQALDAGRVSQDAVDWFRAQLNHTDTLRNDIDASPPIPIMQRVRGVHDSILLSDEVLGRIRAPMYFLWGAEDLFGGEAVATDFVARIAGAELEVMRGAGHAVWLDDPDRAAEATRQFLWRDC